MFGSTYTAVFVKVRNEGKCCFCCFSIYKEKTTEKTLMVSTKMVTTEVTRKNY